MSTILDMELRHRAQVPMQPSPTNVRRLATRRNATEPRPTTAPLDWLSWTAYSVISGRPQRTFTVLRDGKHGVGHTTATTAAMNLTDSAHSLPLTAPRTWAAPTGTIATARRRTVQHQPRAQPRGKSPWLGPASPPEPASTAPNPCHTDLVE